MLQESAGSIASRAMDLVHEPVSAVQPPAGFIADLDAETGAKP